MTTIITLILAGFLANLLIKTLIEEKNKGKNILEYVPSPIFRIYLKLLKALERKENIEEITLESSVFIAFMGSYSPCSNDTFIEQVESDLLNEYKFLITALNESVKTKTIYKETHSTVYVILKLLDYETLLFLSDVRLCFYISYMIYYHDYIKTVNKENKHLILVFMKLRKHDGAIIYYGQRIEISYEKKDEILQIFFKIMNKCIELYGEDFHILECEIKTIPLVFE